jgi:hypothetical protein
MQVTEKSLINALKEKKPEEIQVISLTTLNITKIYFRANLFTNIEFLNLQGNSIKDISFLKNLNKIYYLELRQNPIESFEMIYYHSIFGYLAITLDKYSVKNFLKLRKLTLGHLFIDYEMDAPMKKYFLSNNKDITKFNNEIIYNFSNDEITLYQPSPSKSKSFLNKNNTMFSLTIFEIDNFSLIEQKGEKLNALKNFYENYNNEIKSLQKMFLFVNNTIDKNDQKYLKLEKSKLVNFAKINENFINLNQNRESILNNNTFNGIEEYEESSFNFDISIFKNNEYFPQLVLLSVLNLYILQIIKEDLTVSILKFLYKNLLKRKIQHFAIKNFLNLDRDVLICFYFYFYDHFVNLYEQNKGTDKLKYKDLKTNLEMKKLVLLCNSLKKFNTDETVFNRNLPNEDRKLNINKFIIRHFNNLGIFNEVLSVIQFLSDFIKFYQIDNLLLQNHTFEYRVFIEISFLFYNYLSNKGTDFNFTDRNYRMHKFQILGNTLEYMRKKNFEEESKRKIGLDNKHSTISFFEEIKLEKPKAVKSTDFERYRLIPKGKNLGGIFKQNVKKEYKSLIEEVDSKPVIDNIHEVFTTRLLLDKSLKDQSVNESIHMRRNSFRSIIMRENNPRSQLKHATSPVKRLKLIPTLPQVKRIYSDAHSPKVK